MRVFMLGWEFPPFVSGGLGTACFGLTKALSKQQTEVIFVLPRMVGVSETTHVRLLPTPAPKVIGGTPNVWLSAKVRQEPPNAQSGSVSPAQPAPVAASAVPSAPSTALASTTSSSAEPFANVTFRSVESHLPSPYASAGLSVAAQRMRRSAAEAAARAGQDAPGSSEEAVELQRVSLLNNLATQPGMAASTKPYEGDLLQEAERYAALCVELARLERFDVVHAHDWVTFPAGLAVAAAMGKPLVVHVHSTEYDRAGDNINSRVFDIERRGMLGATRIIAVSHLTKAIVQHRYGIDPTKVEVVYNGIENGRAAPDYQTRARITKGDKIVLFLGRITMQKGPEYFVEAACKVLEKFDKVKFVMAGTGDMIGRIIELAAEKGIGQKVLFTGFLRGKDVERIFKMADVYVMPSVSEPFGIAPLEAISHDVPVIISKTSGVAEVLTHALKVDFWDTHEIANKILAVLKHPPLATTLREHADIEVRRLTWEDAAAKCVGVYEQAMAPV
jgi:glycosyltransferase involved in cell wall biosynthesis